MLRKWTKQSIEYAYNQGRMDFSEENFSDLDLRGADLTEADLRRADLIEAYLRGAHLRGADLTDADLTEAHLRRADLTDADLRGADLTRADLTEADLRGADLTRADLNLSSWPLWCGSRGVTVDKKIAVQLMYHACALDCDDPEYQELRQKCLAFVNQMHRTDVKRLK